MKCFIEMRIDSCWEKIEVSNVNKHIFENGSVLKTGKCVVDGYTYHCYSTNVKDIIYNKTDCTTWKTYNVDYVHRMCQYSAVYEALNRDERRIFKKLLRA